MMKFWSLFISLVFLMSLLFSFDAFAQKNNRKSKKQVLDFEDQLVEGEVNRSELLFLLQKKRYNLGRLIQLREDFLPEMRRGRQKIK